MFHSNRRRWTLLGATLGAAATLALVIGLGLFAGAGTAARSVAPRNTSPPTISGAPQEGQTLTGNRGTWSGQPTDYNDFWVRCDDTGGSCSNISGAHNRNGYLLKAVDVGNTLRFKVQAKNASGSTFASSVPTAVIAAATKPPPKPVTGCPPGTGTAQVADVTPPARLVIDQFSGSPNVVTRSTRQVSVRVHVSDTCGQPVEGALVYATAIPFNQISNAPTAPTDSSGFATIGFQVLGGFPVSQHQQLLVIYSQAKKPGDPPLAGIQASRLTSMPVNLHA
jgi:hypothetical protein